MRLVFSISLIFLIKIFFYIASSNLTLLFYFKLYISFLIIFKNNLIYLENILLIYIKSNYLYLFRRLIIKNFNI